MRSGSFIINESLTVTFVDHTGLFLYDNGEFDNFKMTLMFGKDLYAIY